MEDITTTEFFPTLPEPPYAPPPASNPHYVPSVTTVAQLPPRDNPNVPLLYPERVGPAPQGSPHPQGNPRAHSLCHNDLGGSAHRGSASPHRDRVHEHFNMTKYIIVCTGSGRWYCCCCMLFCWGLLGLGVAIIAYASITYLNGDSHSNTFITLCVLSGIAFMSFCLFWCFAICVTQATRSQSIFDCCKRSDIEPSTNYTVLSCALWVVVIFFIAVASALAFAVYNTLSLDVKVCSSFDSFCLEFSVALLMWVCVLFCFCSNSVAYFFGLRKAVGRVFGVC